MRKSIKIIVIIICITALMCVCSNNVNAFTYSGVFDGGVGSVGNAKTTVTNITSTVLSAVRVAGSGISLIMLTYMFIKYMLSAAGERAELKKNFVPFIIGAVILFAASNIVTIMQTVAGQMFV